MHAPLATGFALCIRRTLALKYVKQGTNGPFPFRVIFATL